MREREHAHVYSSHISLSLDIEVPQQGLDAKGSFANLWS